MIKTIGYYLDKFNSILPSDSDIGNVANELWYVFIKPLFDDKVWNDFYNRKMCEDSKFISGNDDRVLNNIKKTLAIHFKTKNRLYNRLFNAYMSDYNPLWNVDGVTGRITETTHTGTDTDNKTGTDYLKDTGGHSNTRSGSVDLDYTGKESLEYKGSEKDSFNGKESLEYKGSERDTKSGTETDTKSGTETHTKGGKVTVNESTTTYDSGSTFYPTQKTETTPTDTDTLSFTGRTDTKSFSGRYDEKSFTGRTDDKTFTNRYDEKTFQNRSDEKSFTNRTDTTQYNNLTDTFAYTVTGEKHETVFNSQLKKTLDLTDKDIEMIIRQGNIGVTKSSELLSDTLDLYGNNLLMDFVYYVVHDCVNQICSMIY